jgi:hypothetical protein
VSGERQQRGNCCLSEWSNSSARMRNGRHNRHWAEDQWRAFLEAFAVVVGAQSGDAVLMQVKWGNRRPAAFGRPLLTVIGLPPTQVHPGE